MVEQMTKRGFLTICAFFLVLTAWIQGPPVSSMAVTAKKGLKFDDIPVPGEQIDLVPLVPKSNVVMRGNVNISFEDVRVGKFRGGTMAMLVKDKIVQSVHLTAPNKKSSKRLTKQLYAQFGDPYKLEVRQGRHFITWTPAHVSHNNIRFEQNLNSGKSEVMVDRR